MESADYSNQSAVAAAPAPESKSWFSMPTLPTWLGGPAAPAAPTAGRRRHRTRHHKKKGGRRTRHHKRR